MEVASSYPLTTSNSQLNRSISNMNIKNRMLAAGALLMMVCSSGIAKQWTLRECIDYALQNNISLQKSKINKLSAQEDVL